MATDDELQRAARLILDHVGGRRESTLTVAELLAEYYRLHGPTLVNHGPFGSLIRALVKALGDRQVMQLNAALLYEEFRALTPHLSKWTQVLLLRTLKAGCAWAVARGLLPSHPLAAMRLPSRKQGLRSHVRTPEQAAKILAHAGRLTRVVFLLGYDCGMRPTEARTLRWDQLQCHVDDTGRETWEVELTKTKTGLSRVVPLTSRTMDAIRKWPVLPDAPWILCNPRTRRVYSDSRVRALWIAVRTAAGVTGDPDDPRPMGQHSAGRRSSINRARRAGIPDADMMAVTGHVTTATYAYYQVPDARDARRVRDILERDGQQRLPPRRADTSGDEGAAPSPNLVYSQVKKR